VVLREGKAEVFGRELPLEEPLFFHSGDKIALFTWHGAKICISGKCESYTSDKTPNVYYINVHSALNQMRIQALKNKELGPNILITGQRQSGKSSLSRMLLNYSLKLGYTPIFVDLDLSQSEISIPGCISASLIEDSMPNDESIKNTVSYFHGDVKPISHEFLDTQVEELAKAVKQKL
jgi:polyribonucleotide 5'-hydroxyl-kinase